MIGNADTLLVGVLLTEMMLETSPETWEKVVPPPKKSGKRAPILSDMAPLFVRLHLDSKRKMDLGRLMDSRKHRKQPTK